VPAENEVRRQIRAYLKKHKVVHYPIVASPYGNRGAPDFVGVFVGLFFAVECKRTKGGKISKLQQREAKRIKSHGGLHVFARCVEDVETMFTEARRSACPKTSSK